jgi:hypothetical protein
LVLHRVRILLEAIHGVEGQESLWELDFVDGKHAHAAHYVPAEIQPLSEAAKRCVKDLKLHVFFEESL